MLHGAGLSLQFNSEPPQPAQSGARGRRRLRVLRPVREAQVGGQDAQPAEEGGPAGPHRHRRDVAAVQRRRRWRRRQHTAPDPGTQSHHRPVQRLQTGGVRLRRQLHPGGRPRSHTMCGVTCRTSVVTNSVVYMSRYKRRQRSCCWTALLVIRYDEIKLYLQW